ncbi:unnamed protein product [Peronospora belbahrii]|uniref:PRELI/MSF1 domain-containing protein n=1 Tax=Peronospora belbahrii TaxID=622444 RepID=A0ABN8CXC0_9STRA|nr:unnamed protein product [Peronospora belbahrii]
MVFDEEIIQRYRELRHILSPLLWFSMGYCLVLLFRSKHFPWLKGLWTIETPVYSQRTRRRYRRPALVKSERDTFLQNHRIKVINSTELLNGETIVTPCLELTLPEDYKAYQFGDSKTMIPYAVEQTADVYYRKFKEPLPDPACRLLDSIQVLEERHLDEFGAVFKRRLLKFRNEAPSMIKRFASSDYIEYIEDSLLDKQNRRFYVYVKNKSYQSLGILEDFSVFVAHTGKPQWTDLHQFCRVHITSSSLLFFRSKIELFISSYYCKNAPDARSYHLRRIEEEFGDPTEQ